MALLRGNAIVGQSGGPTVAINASLSGIIRASHKAREIEKLYGMKNGIDGLIEGEILDLSYLFGDEKSLYTLESTPACALGSCRTRLQCHKESSEIYKRIFYVLKKYNIRYLFYIGGNDSMDTLCKLCEFSREQDYEIRIIGVPKTIDNDLMCTDHTPGYGSCAKYIATAVHEIAADCLVYSANSVTIIEVMGRDAGWLALSAALPKHYTGVGADLVYFPEIPFSSERFLRDIKRELSSHSSVIAVISEGIKYENGEYVGASFQNGASDVFGHKYLGGAARNLEALVGRKIGCKVRSLELNLPQRCSAHVASRIDIDESVKIGAHAVKIALEGQTGKMASISRKGGDVYEIALNSCPLQCVANRVKYVPLEYIDVEKSFATKAGIDYVSPLILGEREIEYKNGIPVHLIIK